VSFPSSEVKSHRIRLSQNSTVNGTIGPLEEIRIRQSQNSFLGKYFQPLPRLEPNTPFYNIDAISVLLAKEIVDLGSPP
jgi:hypothetical protein